MAKILIIEDDAEVRALIRRLLEGEGYDVQVAENGVDGIEAFRAGSPDVVITDLSMPRQDGIETIKEIRGIDAETKILAISGGGPYSPKTHLKRARRVGAQETLAKPFAPSGLLNAVGRLV